jgi:hypothetical protein
MEHQRHQADPKQAGDYDSKGEGDPAVDAQAAQELEATHHQHHQHDQGDEA